MQALDIHSSARPVKGPEGRQSVLSQRNGNEAMASLRILETVFH
jgi:hypothetical protein